MAEEEGIVRPLKGRSAPDLGPWALLVATRTDLAELCRLLDRDLKDGRRLFNSRLLPAEDQPALVGPVVGAPYAAMVLETLVAWGASRFVFVGWCGAIHPSLSVGDIFLPDAALIDEGTSVHYAADETEASDRSRSSGRVDEAIARTFQASGAAVRKGTVWSTDGIFRETPSRVLYFRDKGALAVDMEVSALFSVARFRGAEIGAALVVSDDLTGLTWRHGFRDPRFMQGRQILCREMATLCREM